MSSVLLDTHTWAWALTGDNRLSKTAHSAIAQADLVFVSPISLFEIGQKVRLGKWPEMDGFIAKLDQWLVEQGGHSAALTPEICLAAAKLDWDHRDPFDRLLAATAIHYTIKLISADKVFDELIHRDDWTARLW